MILIHFFSLQILLFAAVNVIVVAIHVVLPLGVVHYGVQLRRLLVLCIDNVVVVDAPELLRNRTLGLTGGGHAIAILLVVGTTTRGNPLFSVRILRLWLLISLLLQGVLNLL